MTWFDRTTGTLINEAEDIRQSITDIVTTPLGTRLSRRSYGCRMLDMIDQPANQANRVLLYSAVATALLRWEPRITLKRVALSALDAEKGSWRLNLTISHKDDPARREMDLAVPVEVRR